MIPETYISDLQLRLGLYRRLSGLEKREEIDAFAAELVDRFGPLPPEVEHLLDVMEIKGLCRAAGIAKVDAGPKGGVVTLYKSTVRKPRRVGRVGSEFARRSEDPARSAARLSCRLGFAGGAAEGCAGADPAVRRSCRQGEAGGVANNVMAALRGGHPELKSRISPFGHSKAGSSPAMEWRGRCLHRRPTTLNTFFRDFSRKRLALHFAVGRARYPIDEENLARHFVGCEVLRRESFDRRRVGRRSRSARTTNAAMTETSLRTRISVHATSDTPGQRASAASTSCGETR